MATNQPKLIQGTSVFHATMQVAFIHELPYSGKIGKVFNLAF